MTGCIFDGVSPTTRAHIFRQAWITQVFPTVHTFHHHHTRHEADDPFDRWWSKDRADFKVNCACNGCNSGWMDRLDHAAEDILLTHAVTGYGARLDRMADKEIVARWCTLIAVLFDQAQAQPVIGKHVHSSLHEGKIAEGVWVWLAHTDPPPEAPHAFANLKDMVLSVGIGKGLVNESDAYFITFGVGHLVAQVLVPSERTPEGIQFERFTNLAIVRQLWPDRLIPFVWPPPESLPWEQMDVFTTSFQTLDRDP